MSKPVAQTDQSSKARSQADWERIEAEYRAGVFSVREIAGRNGVSHTAIQKHAKRFTWARDLRTKIKAKADALVASREVASREVASREVATRSRGNVATDDAIIEANADLVATVRIGHRKDIARARAQAMGMLDELEGAGLLAQGEHEKLVTALIAGTLDAGGDKDAAMARLIELDKLLQLPVRASVMKALADTMVKLIGLEREAYDLDHAKDAESPDDIAQSVREMLTRHDGAGTGLPSAA